MTLLFKEVLVIAAPKGKLETLRVEPLKKTGKSVYVLD